MRSERDISREVCLAGALVSTYYLPRNVLACLEPNLQRCIRQSEIIYAMLEQRFCSCEQAIKMTQKTGALMRKTVKLDAINVKIRYQVSSFILD